MKLHQNYARLALVVICLVLVWTAAGECRGKSPVSDGYQAAYRYLGNSANNDDRDGLYNSLQGIANGNPAQGHPYWYFSKNIDSNRNTYLFRVPYTEHLAHRFSYQKRKVRLPGGSRVCEHVGDIDYHVYKGVGYIVAGYDECGDRHGRIAFFKADKINGAEGVLAPEAVMDVSGVQGKGAPWVSVRGDGRIYSSSGSGDNSELIFEYHVDWEAVHRGNRPRYTFRPIFLKNRDGSPARMTYKQGADFSSDDRLFYLSTGYLKKATQRLTVFRVSDGNRWYLEKASKQRTAPFRFEAEYYWHEPQGISYFDMNGVSPFHPKMRRGELHVVLLNNYKSRDDKVWIKHYTSIVPVEPGENIQNVYYDKWNGHGLWNGGIMVLAPGVHRRGNLRLNHDLRRVKITTVSGTARIPAR